MGDVLDRRLPRASRRRRLTTLAAGAALVLSGVGVLAPSATADEKWVVVDDDGFMNVRIPVDQVGDVRQVVIEGNFGPSANWAEFGLSVGGGYATGVLGPLEPGQYYYQVTGDDDVTVKDPTNPTSVTSEPEWSTFVVEGEGAELLADAAPEDRGELRELTYRSSVVREDREALAWLPPDYDAERSEPYPVLYLQHGGAQSYRDWVEVGRAAQIFDNLYARDLIQPLVVVMGNGNVPSFREELFRHIVPTAERRLNVSSDPAERALAGLSMGGGHAYEVLAADPGEFAYIGTFGAGLFDGIEDLPVDEINAGTELWRLYVGNPTDVAYNHVHDALARLDAVGVEYEFDGSHPYHGHNWDAWQDNLIDFAQRLFQEPPFRGMSPGHQAIDAPFETPPPGTTPTPWVTEDGYVTFETTTEFADAEHVTVWANWGASHVWTRVPLSRDGDRWRGTVGPLEPGWYHYRLIVDMQSTKDTGNPTSVTTEPTWSQFLVPGASARLVTPVPAGEGGEVHEMTYDSDVAGETRTSLVWTPAGYDADRAEPYPVFFLQHGGGQSYTDWLEMGQAKNILDNHLRDGNLEPMVVVMSNGNVPDFTAELFDHIIPATEENFHVSSDPQQRAMAGLSMGGGHTLGVLSARPGEFGYVATFSAGLRGPMDFDPEAINAGTTLLRLYHGNRTDFTYDSFVNLMSRFDELGIDYEHEWYPGPHGWDTWQYSLSDLAPRLFRAATAHDREGIAIEATIPEAAPGHLVMTVGGGEGPVLLGEAINAGDRLVLLGELPEITVTDSRNEQQARGTGWAVSGRASSLATTSERIDAAYLGWAPRLLDERDGVEAGPAVASLLGGGAGLASPQRLVEASPEARVGTVRSTAGLRLEVPVDTAPGTYAGEVTVSLFPID